MFVKHKCTDKLSNWNQMVGCRKTEIGCKWVWWWGPGNLKNHLLLLLLPCKHQKNKSYTNHQSTCVPQEIKTAKRASSALHYYHYNPQPKQARRKGLASRVVLNWPTRRLVYDSEKRSLKLNPPFFLQRFPFCSGVSADLVRVHVEFGLGLCGLEKILLKQTVLGPHLFFWGILNKSYFGEDDLLFSVKYNITVGSINKAPPFNSFLLVLHYTNWTLVWYGREYLTGDRNLSSDM